MIHYAMACRAADCRHGFESWFGGSAEYDRLERAGLLSCPACGGQEVGKALMAPAVARTPAPAVLSPDDAGRQALRALRRRVEADGTDVGDRFAEQASRMHRGEIEQRPVYGSATPEQVRDLREEGVPFAAVPWVPLEDA